MTLKEKQKEVDTGLTVETYWNIHVPKELLPWLIGIGVALITGSGLVLSSDISGPEPIKLPAPTEVTK